jgi:hypothetical protein
MNKLFLAAVLSLTFLSFNGFSQSETFFRKISGNWEGTLEYLDYSANRRVKLKTYLNVTPSADGNSAELVTVYDDFGKVITERETVRIDLAAGKYFSGDFGYAIDSAANGKIVLLGSGQDGEKIEPIRKTITFDENSLQILKETRTPWQFRNQLILRRASQNILSPKTFSAAELKEDFEVLRKTLTALHPGIYRYQTPESFDALFAEFAAKISAPLSEGEFFLILSQLTSKIGCGHTYLNPYNQNALVRERVFNRKTYLPFYFRIVGGKIIVTENASSANLVKGTEITKINDFGTREIIEKLVSVTHADGKNTLAARLGQIELRRFEAERYALFDWYFPLFFPLKNESFTIEAVDVASKKPFKFEVSAMTKTERTAETEKRYGKAPTYDDGWKFEIWENSVGYLKIENSITWRLKNIKFKEFLNAAFAELRARAVKNLIIDLRGNSGGDTGVGFELAKYLAKTDLPAYIASRRLVRNVGAQPDLLKFLDSYSRELKTELKEGLAENSYKKAENGFYEILPNDKLEIYPKIAPDKNNFAGKTYIVSDASNASATFQFLNYARENRLATIVGEESGGNRQGINGGNYFFLNLPNSRIEIDVPVYYFAPLKPQPDESIIPDFVVKSKPEDIAKGIDSELNRLKKLIRRGKNQQ